jgi:predicted transcriptional regulator
MSKLLSLPRARIIRLLREFPALTIREIGAEVGLSSPATVKHHLDVLHEAGVLRRGRCSCCGAAIWEVVIAESPKLRRYHPPLTTR